MVTATIWRSQDDARPKEFRDSQELNDWVEKEKAQLTIRDDGSLHIEMPEFLYWYRRK